MTLRYKLYKNCRVLAKKMPDVWGIVKELEVLELDGCMKQKGIGLFDKKDRSFVFVYDNPHEDGRYGVLRNGGNTLFLGEPQFIYLCCLIQGIRDKLYKNK